MNNIDQYHSGTDHTGQDCSVHNHCGHLPGDIASFDCFISGLSLWAVQVETAMATTDHTSDHTDHTTEHLVKLTSPAVNNQSYVWVSKSDRLLLF